MIRQICDSISRQSSLRHQIGHQKKIQKVNIFFHEDKFRSKIFARICFYGQKSAFKIRLNILKRCNIICIKNCWWKTPCFLKVFELKSYQIRIQVRHFKHINIKTIKKWTKFIKLRFFFDIREWKCFFEVFEPKFICDIKRQRLNHSNYSNWR